MQGDCGPPSRPSKYVAGQSGVLAMPCHLPHLSKAQAQVARASEGLWIRWSCKRGPTAHCAAVVIARDRQVLGVCPILENISGTQLPRAMPKGHGTWLPLEWEVGGIRQSLHCALLLLRLRPSRWVPGTFHPLAHTAPSRVLSPIPTAVLPAASSSPLCSPSLVTHHGPPGRHQRDNGKH